MRTLYTCCIGQCTYSASTFALYMNFYTALCWLGLFLNGSEMICAKLFVEDLVLCRCS